MKLTWYDRLVALAFHPRYREEYKKLFPSPTPSLKTIFSPGNEIERFKRRWGLDFIVHPDDVERRLGKGLKKDIEGGVFSDYLEMVKPIPHREISDGNCLKPARALRDEKYLTLQIDITADETKILADIRDYIKFYRKVVKFQPGGRAKSSKGLDHWEIYHKVHHEKKSLYKIAQELSGISGSPSVEEGPLKAVYEQVRRALKKADRIMSQVRPQVPR